MATHSSVLAWRIPGTGEPGGLPSMGSHRVRHNWSDAAAAAAAGCWGQGSYLPDWGSAPGPLGVKSVNYRNKAEHKSSSNKRHHFLRSFVPGVLIALFSLIKNIFFFFYLFIFIWLMLGPWQMAKCTLWMKCQNLQRKQEILFSIKDRLTQQ